LGNAQVTIIGDSSAPNDYNQNQVTITNTLAPMSINSTSVLGITWRNINFINTATGVAPAISLRGLKNAFYNCQFISAGSTTITSNIATALIANSYIEGTDKVFYGFLGLYVFGSNITATLSNSATLVYSHGIGTPIQISQTVFDTCNIIQKPGTTNTLVYLAGPNGDGAQVVYKYTNMASLVAPIGSRSIGADGFFGEYLTTGPGSYAAHPSPRNDTIMTSSMVSNCTVGFVFANSFTGYTIPTTSWIDPNVLEAIEAANAVVSMSSSLASSSSLTSTSLLSTSATLSSSLISFTSSSVISSTSATPSSSCVLPSSVPSDAFVVGPIESCATYYNFTAAIAALPPDSTTQHVYILAGTYIEQIPAFGRVGATIFRGESSNPLDQSSNTVTLQFSGGALSSAGGSENFATFRTTQSVAAKHAFYNINFVNTASVTPNFIAIAMDIKAQNVGFYSCGFTSNQGTLLANSGTSYFSGCRIEGSADFVWAFGGAFISNSVIVSNAPANAVAAQLYTAGTPSFAVFDHCAFVPKSTLSMAASTFLGRDYSTSARVAVTNSFLDGHINSAGWLIKTPSTENVTFAEFNNTGPGSTQTSRIPQTQILSDDSAYTLASMFGDISWIDNLAIVPFSGFPESLFAVTPSNSATLTSATPSSTLSSLPTSATFVVSTTPGPTEFRSIEAAISALPVSFIFSGFQCYTKGGALRMSLRMQMGNKHTKICQNDGTEKFILINPGTYVEQVNINRTGKVTLRGVTSFPNDFSKNQVSIQFSFGVSTSSNEDESTPVLYSKKNDQSGLSLYNIDFINTFPQTPSFASLAADFYGNNMAAYGCSFVGYQDTLLANHGTQLFSNCYIEGSVDFVWGFSKAYFHQCYIATNTPGAGISAQSSSIGAIGGYVFDKCLVTYTHSYGSSMGKSFLGRPYSNYSVAVYKNSYLDENISPAGWSVWQANNPQTSNVMFGEYNNTGPSAWSSSRVSFATNLTEAQVAAYDIETFLGSTSWIDTVAFNFIPSFSFSATETNGTTTPTQPAAPTGTASNGTASHPSSGTIPPNGAVLVSVGGLVESSFANLTTALASLPSDTTSQVIFVYPGSYTEQVSINRPGSVTVIGFQTGDVGQTYTENQVTITFSRGLSVVAPVAAGHTDAETAVMATASNRISFYNIDFVNTLNLDGAIASFVTLAASVFGDQIGFYVSDVTRS
jgi:pectin methylesterase-like acyl-CoA thioesterase